ncbi:S41 family peptidase [Massilia sp. UMI-21]|nr:S41 family peptidase [Massilia sp. UMI-21]
MKKKWIVISSVLALTMLVVFTMPILKVLWQQFRPKPTVVVDRAMRSQAIETLVAKMNSHYIFPDKARQIETLLRQRQQAGKYDAMTDGHQLAEQLTQDLQSVSRDKHMEVGFAPGLVLPDDDGLPPPETQAAWEQRNNVVMRMIMRHMADRRVEEVEHLSPGIGYLKIAGFPPPFLVADKFAAAMNQLADTDGLIVDLRDNGGGGTASVALLISYFVDQRTHLNDIWDRQTGNTIQHWTQDRLDGKRYGGKKPVMILVGPGTMSAGEDFAYTMQALKRATVVGEPTWGGANPARPHRIGEHFYVTIAGRRVINPITRTNWEGVGVTPDIAATPDQALAVAKDVLQRRLRGSASLVAAGQ